MQDRSYVARQPIVDDRLQVFGYELLCRGSNPDGPWLGPKNHASARVVDDAVLSIGLEALALGKRAFLNLSREILLSDALAMLPPEQIVLEILEDVQVDREVIDMCRSLHTRGFTIALDDFTLGSSAEALLPFARIVKVDVRATPAAEWAPLASRLKKNGVRLVAEKVETLAGLEEAFARARAADRSYVIVIRTDPFTWTGGDAWWDVGVPEVSGREQVRVARAEHEAERKRHRLGI